MRRNLHSIAILEQFEPRLLLSAGYVEWLETPPGDHIGNTMDSALNVELNALGDAMVKGMIDTNGDVDVFQVVATQTGTMQIKIRPGGRHKPLDSQLRTYDADGKLLGFKDNGGVRDVERLSVDVVEGEVYYIEASSYDSASNGRYALNLVTEEGPPPGPTNDPPVLEFIGDQVIEANVTLNFTIIATDFDEDELAYLAMNIPDGAAFDGASCTFSWTPSDNQVGLYGVTFVVTDGELQDSETVTIEVTAPPVNEAPVLAAIADASVLEEENLQVTLSASDPEGDALMFFASNLPEGASFDETAGVFSWTPTIGQAGTYNVTYGVTDGELSDSQAVTIEIIALPVNEAPVLAAIADASVLEEGNLQVTLSASDPEGDALMFFASNLPEGASFDETAGMFSWTPTIGQAGTYNVTYGVTDGELSDSQVVSIEVTALPVNEAPVLAAIADASVLEEENLQVTLSASDPEGDALMFFASNLPEGASFDETAGVFSWTPTIGQAGTYNVTYGVTDGELSDSQAVSIEVIAASGNHAPAIDPIADESIDEAQAIQLAVTATDTDGDALTYSASNLPGGATFDVYGGQNDQLALEAWFKADDFGTNDARIISKSTSQAEQDHYWMLSTIKTGGLMRLRFRLKTGGVTTTLIASSGDLVAGQWVHAVATYDGTTMRLYKDGVEVGSKAKSGEISTNQAVPVWIGNNPVDPKPFDGVIDEVRVWNRALSAAEVQAVRSGGLPAVSSAALAAHWSFDDGGQTVTDLAGNGHTGTVSGAWYTTGKSGLGMAFDGFNDYVSVGSFDAEGAVGGQAVFNWTPAYDQAGTYVVTFNVSDGNYTTSEDVVITVNNVNRPPILGSVGDRSVQADQTLSFTVAAGDLDGDQLTYSAGNLPQGATFDAATGSFNWTPTAAQVGVYSGTHFEVTDGMDVDYEDISITVTEDIPPDPPPVDPPSDIGGRNVLYIDNDGDGYGVASPAGPDADDNDPTVNTYDSAIAKYGSIESLVQHLGYNPDRILFGPQSSGSLQPGDMVIYGEGTYKSTYVLSCAYVDGTADKPIVFLAMPGERVVLNGDTVSINVKHSSYLVFDGFIVDHTSGSSQAGINSYDNRHITYRNIEAKHHYRGWFGMQDLHDIVFENGVVHDNLGSHGIYLGARERVNTNITIRGSLVYHSGRHGIQHNGRITNFVVENNVSHSNSYGGVSFVNGVHDSVIRGNLIFNNNRQGIVLHHGDSLPAYDQVNNLIENNIIWIGRISWQGDDGEPGGHSCIDINDATSAQVASMDGTVIRNNIMVTYHGATIRMSNSRFLNNMTIEGNVMYQMDGPREALEIAGGIYDFDSFEALSGLISDNTYGDPLFADVSPDYWDHPEWFDFTRSW